MCSEAYKLKAVFDESVRHHPTLDMVSCEDWEELNSVVELLKPISLISTSLGTSQTSKISATQIELNMFHANAAITHENPAIPAAAEAMLPVLIGNTPNVKKTPTSIAMYLDVMVKKKSASQAIAYKRNLITTKHAKYALIRSDSSGSTPPSAYNVAPAKSLIEWFNGSWGTDSDDEGGDAYDELYRLSQLKNIPANMNLIRWWCNHQKEYPVLFLMACNYLVIPPSSVAAEQANSLANRIFENRETLHWE
ncbi:hypothetical protein HDU98_005443 [Podochytrium sp. JEL0797]|nr:hypothetical protein HDU98_005443 [Podochytrium sp. JEL0797]